MQPFQVHQVGRCQTSLTLHIEFEDTATLRKGTSLFTGHIPRTNQGVATPSRGTSLFTDQTPHTNQDVATPYRRTSLFTGHTPYTRCTWSTLSRGTSLFTGHTPRTNQDEATPSRGTSIFTGHTIQDVATATPNKAASVFTDQIPHTYIALVWLMVMKTSLGLHQIQILFLSYKQVSVIIYIYII